MINPSTALKEALKKALMGKLGPEVADKIFDQPTERAAHPYVTLGAVQVLPDKAGCYDGVIAYPIIDIWSQKPGFDEAQAIATAIVNILDEQPDALELPGFTVVIFEIESLQPLRDPNGKTRRVSLTFRTEIQ